MTIIIIHVMLMYIYMYAMINNKLVMHKKTNTKKVNHKMGKG